MSVIFFSHTLSLWDTFFLFYFEHHSIALLFHLSATDVYLVEKHPSLPCLHKASSTVVATGTSSHTNLLICGLSVVLAPWCYQWEKRLNEEECWKSKPALTKKCIWPLHFGFIVTISLCPSVASWDRLLKRWILSHMSFHV
jgi:hypothetical protein